MRNLLVALIVVVIAIAGLVYSQQGTKYEVADEKPVVKIGVIYPMSGDFAQAGKTMLTAIEIFEEDQDTKQNPFEYKFFIEDGQLNPAKSVTVAKKLIEIDKVDIIMSMSSDIGQAISPITEKAKVIHIALATEENVAKGRYNFTTSTPPNKNTEKLVSELNKRNLKNVAFVVQNTSAMMSVAGHVRLAAERGEINIQSDNSINSGERDFRILITQILKDNPDVVIAQLQPPEITIFVKQLKEAKGDVIITNIESMGYSDQLEGLEGYWFINATSPRKTYMDKFVAKTGSETSMYSELFYAGLEVLRNAIKSQDKEEIIENILKSDFISVAVGQITFDSEGMMQTDASLSVIKGGRVEVIEE